jgi:hypothetical protein
VEPRFTDTPSLRRFVLLLAEDESDPSIVAGKILAEATFIELRVIGEVALRGWAWEQMKRGGDPLTEDETASTEDPVVPAFSDAPGRPKQAVRTYTDSRGTPRAGWKQRDFVDAYQSELRKYVKVSSANGDNKRLGDCTLADLAYMVQCRRKMAAANTAEADKFDSLADAMKAGNVTTVADLPREVGEKILLK